MTPLTTFTLGLPVLRDRVHILYATPRTPTPFEAVVLDMVHRFAQVAAYRDWSLETIFEELLCVPDPRALLSATLVELKALGILGVDRPFDDTEDLPLGALTLTERGKKMLSEKKLLGRQQEQVEPFAHDPLSGLRCDERRWTKLSTQPPPLALAVEDFDEDWPEPAFVDNLQQNRPDWYRADTQIESMWVEDEVEVAWDTVTVHAYLDKGTIRWHCERDVVTDYLAQLDPASGLRSAIIETLFAVGVVDTSAWPIVTLSADAIAAPAARVLNALAQQSHLLLSHHGAAAMNAQRKPTAPRAVRMQQSPSAGTPAPGDWQIAWNASNDGCIVSLAHDAVIGDCDLASDTEGWRLCRAPS